MTIARPSRFAIVVVAAGCAISIALAQGARFRLGGSVRTAGGESAGGIELVFASDAGPERTVKVGKGGSFSVAFFPAGEYAISARSDEVFLASVEIVVRDGTGLTLQRESRTAHPALGLPRLNFVAGTAVELNFVTGDASERERMKRQLALAAAKDDLGTLRALFDAGDMPGVLRAADEVLARRPDLAPAHYLRGVALLAVGRAADAVAAEERALAIAPDQPGARAALGSALLQQGRSLAEQDDGRAREFFSRAADAFAAALEGEADPDARVRTNLALALDLAERRDEAMRVLEELIARKPDLLAAYFRLAQLHRAAGNPDRAVEVLSRIPVGEASEAGEALYNVAVELYNDRHYDLALNALDRARDVRPDLALVDRLRGYVLIAQGHTAAGAQALRTFIERAPGDPHVAQDRALLDGLEAR